MNCEDLSLVALLSKSIKDSDSGKVISSSELKQKLEERKSSKNKN